MEGVDDTNTADFVCEGGNHIKVTFVMEGHLVAGAGIFLIDGVAGGNVIGGGGALGGGHRVGGVTSVDWLHCPTHRDGKTA